MFHSSYSIFFLLLSLFPFITSQAISGGSQAPTVTKFHYSSSLTFQIEPREEICFYEELINGRQFKMEFEVARGGLLDINLKIFDAYNQVIVERLAFFNRQEDSMNEAEGRVELTARSSGTHRICFDNSMSRWTPKVVSFFLYDTNYGERKDEIAKLSHLGPIVDSVIKIADTLDSIEGVQHHLKIREQSHRDHIEADNARVQWLSILECVLLVGMAIFQLRSIVNWFQENKKFGRV